MAKTQDEINELLASDLFQKGIQDKYIIIQVSQVKKYSF